MADDRIGDDEAVLRHIPGGTTFQAPGPRITRKNFELRPAETGVSVGRAGLTQPAGLMARIGNPASGSRIAVASVRSIRALGLEVVAVPIAEDTGHAEIRPAATGLDSQAVRKLLADLFQFLPPDPANSPPETGG